MVFSGANVWLEKKLPDKTHEYLAQAISFTAKLKQKNIKNLFIFVNVYFCCILKNKFYDVTLPLLMLEIQAYEFAKERSIIDKNIYTTACSYGIVMIIKDGVEEAQEYFRDKSSELESR